MWSHLQRFCLNSMSCSRSRGAQVLKHDLSLHRVPFPLAVWQMEPRLLWWNISHAQASEPSGIKSPLALQLPHSCFTSSCRKVVQHVLNLHGKDLEKSLSLTHVIPTGVGGRCQHFLKDLGVNISRDTTAAASSWDVSREDNYLIKEPGSSLLVCHIQNILREHLIITSLFERALWKLCHRKRGFPSSTALSEWEAGSAHPQLPPHFSQCHVCTDWFSWRPSLQFAGPINLYHLFFKIIQAHLI